MKTLVEQIAKALVDQPDAVEVESQDVNGTTALRLKVAPSDLGKIIGRQGRTARFHPCAGRRGSSQEESALHLDIAE